MMRTLTALIISLLAISSVSISPARADIELSPLRHVLSDDSRHVQFTLSNPSTRIIDARVGWIDLTATQTGYAPAAREVRPHLSAAPYLTVSPAQFRLEPGARMNIVIKLKEGVKPPAGERRSHLLIETGAARTYLRKASSGLQADIGASVSVPVILRGRGASDAILTDTQLLRDDEGMLMISTAVKPAGDHSTYGRLTARFKAAADKKHKNLPERQELLASRDNVVGYPDAERRLVELPLGFFSLGAGELTLRYEGRGEYEGRVFDERSFTIAPPSASK